MLNGEYLMQSEVIMRPANAILLQADVVLSQAVILKIPTPPSLAQKEIEFNVTKKTYLNI